MPDGKCPAAESAAPARRRVLFVNRSYWPDCEATGQLLTELCEDLAEQFEVEVICGQPNQNPDELAYRRLGTERRGGVRITRVPHTRFSKARRRGPCLQSAFFRRAESSISC